MTPKSYDYPAPQTKPVLQSLLKTYAIVLLFIALKAAGNLSLAFGMRHQAPNLSANPLFYIEAMLDPFVALGVVMLIVALLTRMVLLSVADLSFILPVTAVGYILATFLGKVVLHEIVTPQRWLGTILIFLGAALVSSTPQKTSGGPSK
jgi:drug/metabolite transporter (DMT)-like permease